MGDFEKEKNKIINAFIESLRNTTNLIDSIKLTLKNADKAVSTLTPLETEIEVAITSYETKEALFKSNLVALYKKYNKPHPLTLEKTIEGKEDELKKYVESVKQKIGELDEKALKESVNPDLFVRYLNWSISLDFDQIKERYKEYAKNPKNVESQMNESLRSALKKVMKTHR